MFCNAAVNHWPSGGVVAVVVAEEEPGNQRGVEAGVCIPGSVRPPDAAASCSVCYSMQY